MNELVFYGASGHAKVVMDAVNLEEVKLSGFFDDDIAKKTFKNLAVNLYSKVVYSNAKCIISIGDNTLRKQISLRVQHTFITVIAKSAGVSDSAIIKAGTFVAQKAVIQADVVVGNHCIINTNSSLDHDCVISDFVHVAPGATICGGVHIDEGTLIGAGSVILPNIKIGKWCTIGAGSVVTKNVDDYSTIKGNPAK